MPAEKPPILLATAPATVGGLEMVVEALATGLAARGWPVAVALSVGVTASDPPLAQRLGAMAGVAVHVGRHRGRAYRAEAAWLRATARAVGAQLLHTHGYRADVVGRWATHRDGVPHVMTFHGFTGGGARNRLYEWLQIRVALSAAAAIAVAAPIAERLRRAGVESARLHVIRNAVLSGDEEFPEAVPARLALGLDPERRWIGAVGRLSPEKGQDLLLEGFAALHRVQPDVGLALVGDGPLRPRLAQRIQELGLTSHVVLLGVRLGAGRLVRAFDVLALPSRTEGTPIILLEAMAAQVPVVAMRVGGVPDTVSNREAWLVPPGDVRALTSAMGDCLDQPAEADRRTASARDRLRREHDRDRWLDRYEQVYRSVMSPKKN